MSITGIVGPNGAGKTTLFNLLTGIYAADHGQLVVGDATVARSGWQPHKIARLGVARTFQSARVFPNLNVFDNVLVGAEAAYGGGSKGTKRRSAAELADEVSALLTALDLSERSRAPASTLPAGSQVVVMDAGAVIASGDPAAVQADPTVRAAYLGAAE